MTSGAPAGGPITIVIVDDHPVIRAGLRALLDREGLCVIAEASSAEEAIDVVRRVSPCVVLLDYTIRGGMDGASATRALARLAPSPAIVLLVTLESAEEIARGLAAGAVAVVAKDVCPSEMEGAVRAAAALRKHG